MYCILRVPHQSFKFLNKLTKIGPYFYLQYSSTPKILEIINYISINSKIKFPKKILSEMGRTLFSELQCTARKAPFPSFYNCKYLSLRLRLLTTYLLGTFCTCSPQSGSPSPSGNLYIWSPLMKVWGGEGILLPIDRCIFSSVLNQTSPVTIIAGLEGFLWSHSPLKKYFCGLYGNESRY